MEIGYANFPPDWNGTSYSGYFRGFSVGENDGLKDAFKTDSKSINITFTAGDLPEGWTWTPMVWMNTYLPFVSLSGSGTAIEDGSGDGKFTAHRSGGGTVLSEGLEVKVKQAAGTADNMAEEGKDYAALGSIAIPSNQNDGSKDVQAIDDPDAEGVEDIYQSVQKSPLYMLAAPPATAPATNATTAKGNIDDDAIVRSIKVKRVDWADVPGRNGGQVPTFADGSPAKDINRYFGYNFTVQLLITGEHLDQILVSQDVKSRTQFIDPDTGAIPPLDDPDNQDYILSKVRAIDPDAPRSLVNSQDDDVTDPSPGGAPWTWHNMATKLGSHDGISEMYDEQSFFLPTYSVPDNATVRTTFVTMRTMRYKLRFTKNPFASTDAFPSAGWGYYWTNDVCEWTAAEGAPDEIDAASHKHNGIGRFDSSEIEGLDDLN